METSSNMDSPPTYTPPPIPLWSKQVQGVNQDGFINYIRMKTFMTHKDLDCSWNADQNIVFVNGPNGSGKSAILSGIQIVLGYKAVNTNRTNSVTGFIKKGCRSATIEACFSNTQGALPKDTYGEQIVIMRKILMSGASNYKVSTPDKKLRPCTLNEVTRIRIALNIDPYNPCQFLQQERNTAESKKAGGIGKGQKKDFQMMKDATQITSSEDILKTTKENLTMIKGIVAKKKEYTKFLALQEKQLKEDIDRIRRIEENEGIVQTLHIEGTWAEVYDREEDLKDIRIKKEKLHVEMEELKEEKKRLEDEKNGYELMKSNAKELIDMCNEEISQLTKDKEAKMNEFREVTNTHKRVQNDFSLILKAIKGYTKKITELEAQLNEDTIIYEEQNQVYRNEIEKGSAAILEMESELETIRQKRDSIMTEKNEFIAREQKGQEIVKKYEAELRQTKKEMCKKGNFGPGMIELEAMIAKTRWLSDPPVGPLGKYIQVNDEAYAPLIEHILGMAALFAFVVRTQEDFRTLKQIIDDIYGVHRDKGKGREPTIISLAHFDMTGYFEKFKMTEREFSPFRTVLSMLTITDEMAKVGVIERTGCELILLFEDNTAAAAVMKEENKVPGKMSAAYTLQWYRVTPYPRYAFQPLHGIKRHTEIIPMTQMDTETHVNEQIAYEKGVIKTCRSSLKGYKDGPIYRPGLENQLREEDNKLNMLNKKIHQMRNQIKHAQMMIKQSQPDDKDKNIQNQIKSEQDMKAEQEMESKVRLQEIELAKAEVTRIAAEKANIETHIGESQQKLKELEGEYNNVLGTVGKIGNQIDSYKGKIERLERDFHQFSRLETKVDKEITERTEKAVAVGERPAILLRNPETVRSELKELEALLAKNGDMLQRKPIILEDYEKSRDLLANITIDIDSVDFVLKLFEPYVKVTDDHLEKRKKEIAHELETKFYILCERNNLTGKLMVDWNEERIIYYVSPDKHSDARAKQYFTVKEGLTVLADRQGIQNYCSNLSGGERQKSLVFFIMSMWEVANFPCHFVDEFETCMDDHSRIRIQQLLIKHAQKNPNKLFFFFTPQVLAGVPTDDPTIHFISLKKIN